MANTAKSMPSFTPASLFVMTLFYLTVAPTTAWRHPSYHERIVAATQMVAQARARANSEDLLYNSPWGDSQGGGENFGDTDGLLQQLMAVDGDKLREAVLESVSSLLERGMDGSGSNSSSNFGTLREQQSGQAVQETPEEYHTCLNHTAETIMALVERKRWALLMVDAMGKPAPAVSEGNFLWVGAYEMCQKIRANTSLPTHPDFSGKYCYAYAQVTVNTAFGTTGLVALGLCVPDTCSEFDMTALLNDVVIRLGIKLQIGVECPPPSIALDTKAIVAIVICSLLLLLMVAGTTVDVGLRVMDKWRQAVPYVSANGHGHQDEHLPLLTKTQTPAQDQPNTLLKLLLCFSVYTNGSKLLSTSQPPGSLTCVHGIRFLSMTWVVVGHGFLFPMTYGENVAPYLQEALNRWTFQAICNALVSVDSFFVLSGLLVSYLTLKELHRRNGKLNWFMFYFHRFWRLTPAYMLVIMVYLCISPYWISGPMKQPSEPDRESCQDHWWTNLLYLNNFVYPSEMCLGQSWYLANDMQFYCVLSPLVILPLYYYPIAGYVVSAVLVLVHCVTSAALTVHYNFPPGMFAQVQADGPPDMTRWEIDFYMKPYTRWGPYVIGLVAGYFLFTTKCKLNIRWYVNGALWSAATAAALAVLYGLYGATTGHPMTVGVSAFYNAMNRNVWAVCLCWVIVACVTGNGGFVDTLLSWPGFIPLSRLTYCIYLVHILMMSLYLENLRSLFYFSDINVVMFFLAILVVSYMAAAVTSLAFEAPMMALEKVIFSSRSSQSHNTNSNNEQQQQQNGVHVKT